MTRPSLSRSGKGHHGHFYCGQRFCVPHFLFEEFQQQLGRELDLVKVLRWLKRLDRQATNDALIIENTMSFVRDAYRAVLKTQQIVPKKKVSFVHGFEQVREILSKCPHTPTCLSCHACVILRRIEAGKELMRHERQRDDSSPRRPAEGIAPAPTRSDPFRYLDP